MAGIGEASAIVGVIHVGFSLATTLNTYLSDISDAGDDISSLVSDIEATFGQLRDLGKLIERNETTKAWTEDGLRNAKKCVTDCEKIISKLRHLLKKSTASVTSDEVSRDEIDVSKLERARWPFIKPQMEVRRRELQSIKQDIMIAYSSYMTRFGTDAERKRFTDDLPRLRRTRALARRQVREAKEQRRRQVSCRQRMPRPRTSMYGPPSNLPNELAYVQDSNGFMVPVSVPRASASDDGRSPMVNDDDEEGPLIFQNVDELEREFEVWKAEDDKEKAIEEAEKKMIREEAVKTWKEQLLREVEVRRQKTENERSSLRAELTKQRVSPQQIEEIINHVHPQEQMDNDLQLLSRTIASDKASSVASGDGPPEATSSRRWLIWSKNKSSSSQRSHTASTLVNESQSTSVPDILRDPTAEGGMAPLEASYFQRSLGILGLSPKIKKFNVDIPDQWLLDSLVKKQAAVVRDPKKVNSIWKQFSQLPEDYRHTIGEHVEKHEDSRGGSGRWVLLHLECIFEKRHRNMLDRGSRREITGVYVVLKQNREPKDHGIEREDLEKKAVFNGEEIILPHSLNGYWPHNSPEQTRGQSSYEPPARRASSKSTYEPYYAQTSSRKEYPGSSYHRSREQSKKSSYQEPEDEFGPPGRSGHSGYRHVSPYKAGPGDLRYESRHKTSSLYERDGPSYSRTVAFSDDHQNPPSHATQRKSQGYPSAGELQAEEEELRLAIAGIRRAKLRDKMERADLLAERERLQAQGHQAYPGQTIYPNPRPVIHNVQRPNVYSPRSSRSRSHSPRPIRRSATDESYRSSDSLTNPAQGFRRPRFHNRPEVSLHGPDRLIDIAELSESRDELSSSSFSDNSEDDDPTRRPRHKATKTDQELLDETLKEYVNPQPPRADNAVPDSAVPATGGTETSGEHLNEKTLQNADPSIKSHAQPSAEEVDDDVAS